MAEPDPGDRPPSLGRPVPQHRAEHPKLPAALLLVGVTLLIVLLSVWSTLAPS